MDREFGGNEFPTIQRRFEAAMDEFVYASSC